MSDSDIFKKDYVEKMIVECDKPPIKCECGSLHIMPITMLQKGGKDYMLIERCIKCKREYHIKL